MINLTNFTLILRHLYLVELTLNTKKCHGISSRLGRITFMEIVDSYLIRHCPTSI